MHVSNMELPNWGKVSANGMVVLTDNQLIVVDTLWTDEQTEMMIDWYRSHYDFNEIKVIISHFHDDNLGGLNWVNQNSIESYSIGKTREICVEKALPVASTLLSNSYRFDFNEIPVEIFYPGEGHSIDNICVYLPSEKILFGGCSVKAINNITLGNISDANLQEWPITLQKMREKFSEAEIVVPGQGLPGDITLIDHTHSLF
jgi:metallo-beta-lactamase class B